LAGHGKRKPASTSITRRAGVLADVSHAKRKPLFPRAQIPDPTAKVLRRVSLRMDARAKNKTAQSRPPKFSGDRALSLQSQLPSSRRASSTSRRPPSAGTKKCAPARRLPGHRHVYYRPNHAQFGNTDFVVGRPARIQRRIRMPSAAPEKIEVDARRPNSSIQIGAARSRNTSRSISRTEWDAQTRWRAAINRPPPLRPKTSSVSSSMPYESQRPALTIRSRSRLYATFYAEHPHHRSQRRRTRIVLRRRYRLRGAAYFVGPRTNNLTNWPALDALRNHP